MTTASTSALPTALPSSQPIQPQAGNGSSATAGAPEPDGAFANALQQARQGARLREAQAERRSETRRSDRAASEAQPGSSAERRAETSPPEAAERAGAGTPEADPAGATATATEPVASLPAWLESALARASAGGAASGDSIQADATDTGDSQPEGIGAERDDARRLPPGLSEVGKAQGEGADARAHAAGDGDADGAHAAFEATLAEASTATPESAASAEHIWTPVTAAEPQQQATSIAAGAASAAPGATSGALTETVERPLAAHVQSADFAPALGAQLNILVKDGVSEARLHLNPAEMGPITVQIHIEGQTARVEMVAEHAATRQALEQSMPALAGALRDSGLTLTGGGVFEQARDPRQGDPQGRPSRGAASGNSGDGNEPGLESGRPARLPAGVVDVYA